MATDDSQSLALRKPTSIWNRKVKFDVKPLFKSLGKAATHTATLKFEELGNDALEVATSLGIETPDDELAFSLIRISLLDALSSLTRESLSHFEPEALKNEQISADLDTALSKVTINIGEDFFQRPEKQEFLTEITLIYGQWLCDRGLAPNKSQTIANRLPAYYVFALANEWRRNSQTYKRLLERQGGPFSLAEESLKGWGHYFKFLRQRISENVFDEPFCLAQVYVPLNAYYIDRTEVSTAPGPKFRAKEKRVCVRLEADLIAWLRTKDKSDPIRVISGGPGSGKSSFARVFCCDVAEAGIAKPIYIPLHLIDPTRDVASELDRFIRDEGLIGFNPLDADRREDGILVVFDGLDELASMGKVAAQVARDFIQAVEKMVERRNLGANPINIIISGRELVVQENETEFRRPRQVLTILPYHITDDKESYVDPKSILSTDLRQQWWINYGALIGTAFDGVPAPLQMSEIDEITSQPLLNYLVALSYRRGKIDFTRKLNLNNVYADLVAAVHERGYEKRRTYRPISHITLRDFIRVLEEIGLAAWHGSDGRSTSVRDILTHCQQSGLEALLKSFTEGAQAGVTKLLAAFFFRRSGEAVGDDATFVFTHKSFGEYLTATRLVRGLERIVIERRRRRENADDGFDVSDSLVHWLRLAGPAQMTDYVQMFLRREVAQRPQEELGEWQQTFTELLSFALEASSPLERVGNLTFAQSSRYDVNALVSLFIALNSTSVALERPAQIRFATDTAFGTFLRRVCPQRSGPQSSLLFTALSYLDLSGQCLDMADLYGANLQRTILKGCRIHFATLTTANLTESDFTDAILSWSRMDGARIHGATFERAKLEEVRFSSHLREGGSLKNVNFTSADLRRAAFVGAHVVDCNFTGALLSASTLHKTRRMEACILDGAVIGEDEKSFIQWALRGRSAGDIRGSLKVVASDSHEVASKDR